MTLEQLTSAIYNNIVSGLPGVDVNSRFTLDQIEDSIISERQAVIKEYAAKGLIPIKDLLLSINCIVTDDANIDRCCSPVTGVDIKHIEVPQILNDFAGSGIEFIGSPDRSVHFKVYTDYGWKHHAFKTRRATKPYVWIDTTPNKNNLYDGYIFNAPTVDTVSIAAVFKDPRQVAEYSCCDSEAINNISYIDKDIEKRVTENYIRYYRQMATAHTPNDQTIK